MIYCKTLHFQERHHYSLDLSYMVVVDLIQMNTHTNHP